MSRSGRIRTLRDLDLLEGSASVSESIDANGAEKPNTSIAHIPHLPQSDRALQLLRRIHKEFYPIIVRRGYNVSSISEMCCCGDGLDCENSKATTTANRDSNNKRRKTARKNKKKSSSIMSSNVLGYNQTHFRGRHRYHEIHLRLRDARDHTQLFSYESIAGTMSHELAHCLHGPHDAQFYKLMDDIQEQHAAFLIRGVVTDQDGFPLNSPEARVLGGSRPTASHERHARRGVVAAAAKARQQRSKWMPQGPQRLGGSVRTRLPPGIAAARAAEQRRLVDEVWCQPCQPNKVIELLSESEEEEEGDDEKHNTKLPRKTNVIIEVDSSDDDDEREEETTKSRDPTPILQDEKQRSGLADSGGKKGSSSKREHQQPATRNGANVFGWACEVCTFRNTAAALACSMCATPREVDNSKVLAEITREDTIQRIKETEVEQSKRDFGFNIYGTKKKSSNLMRHIT